MNGGARRLAALFMLALTGVVGVLAVLLDRVAGPVAAVLFGLLLAVPAASVLVQAQRRNRRLAAGRTCTCCTATVHDPVQVR